MRSSLRTKLDEVVVVLNARHRILSSRAVTPEGIAALREVLVAVIDHIVLEKGKDPVIVWR